jgi:acetyltransferase-like isoleucine patch superfamily enzyme
VVLRHPQKIRLGNNVIIDDNCVLDAKGETNEGIFIGDNVMIGRNTVLSCKDGSLKIGDNTNIAMNCFIQSAKTVTIGKNVLIAAYSYIIGGGNHEAIRTDIPIIAQGQVVKRVVIEDNVWLGASVKVQDGVTIGRDSIIGTGAVVTKSIPEFSVAVGVPAKVIKKRK